MLGIFLETRSTNEYPVQLEIIFLLLPIHENDHVPVMLFTLSVMDVTGTDPKKTTQCVILYFEGHSFYWRASKWGQN